jgi:hypothetical protein
MTDFSTGHLIIREDATISLRRPKGASRKGVQIAAAQEMWGEVCAAAAKAGVVLVCNPLSPARAGIPDARSLGLPVTSIAIHPLP